MSVALYSEPDRRQALRRLYRALEDNDTPPRGIAHDSRGLRAALGPAPHTKRAWFLECLPPMEASDPESKRIDAYRAYCFDPTHSRKPTTDPRAHARGEFLTTKLVTCQLFILDFPPSCFQSFTSLATVLHTASEKFMPTLRDGQHVQEKTTIQSVREVLSLYRRFHNYPVRPLPTDS